MPRNNLPSLEGVSEWRDELSGLPTMALMFQNLIHPLIQQRHLFTSLTGISRLIADAKTSLQAIATNPDLMTKLEISVF
jgi:hypothetical protein